MQPAYPHSAHLSGVVGSRPSGGGFVVAIAIAACLVAFALAVMWTVWSMSRGYTDGVDGDSGSEGGGGPGGVGAPDLPGPSPDDPAWWPAFERQFADYVSSSTRSPGRA